MRQPYLHLQDRLVEQIDLAVIVENETEMFSPEDPADINANKFMSLDEYGLIMVTSLFTEEAAQHIARLYEEGLEPKGD